MKRKSKILLVGDQPGWAFHNIIRFIKKELGSSFDLYYDFNIYHPLYSDPNAEISYSSKQNLSYRRSLWLQNIPLLRGLEYRLIKFLNQRNWIEFNENGKFQKVDTNNDYDLVVYLDYYFQFDGDFSHIKSTKIIQGTFSDVFPPRKMVRIPSTGEIAAINDGNQFCSIFMSHSNALLVGSPSIIKKYKPFYDRPIIFANMAYDEQIFCPKLSRRSSSPFLVGWTGNPDREFKGFHSIILPAIVQLQKEGYEIELKTQFEGTLNSLADFWQGVDLAVIASEADAGPSLFMEASLCGVPSVSTKIGMPEYVIEDGVNGLFCERSIEDLSAKIKFIIEHPDLYSQMKSRIRQDYIMKLGKDIQVNNWKNLFKIVLDNEQS